MAYIDHLMLSIVPVRCFVLRFSSSVPVFLPTARDFSFPIRSVVVATDQTMATKFTAVFGVKQKQTSFRMESRSFRKA